MTVTNAAPYIADADRAHDTWTYAKNAEREALDALADADLAADKAEDAYGRDSREALRAESLYANRLRAVRNRMREQKAAYAAYLDAQRRIFARVADTAA